MGGQDDMHEAFSASHPLCVVARRKTLRYHLFSADFSLGRPLVADLGRRETNGVIYTFEDYSLDTERRELRRGGHLVAVEPQVFDLLQFLIPNRTRVVSKDELIAEVWHGRIVSESTLSSRITLLRRAIGDSGEAQRLIRTIPRKGLRFVGEVREEPLPGDRSPVAPALRQQGEEAPPPSEPGPGGPERRQLTIIVCDVGAAALSMSLDPEVLREIIIACSNCVKEVVEPFGGAMAKSIANDVLVYFGYPQAYEDDAERAVRAALAATSAIAKVKIESLAIPLQARTGIATGLVVIGDSIGTDTASEPAIAGETLHLAARLAGLAAPGTILISASTRRLIGHLFEYCDLCPSTSSGIPANIEATQVLRESTIESRFKALRSDRTKLIGRDEELDLLLRRWKQAKTGEGRVVLLWGEPGIGKSRLAAALRNAVKAEPHTCLQCSCSPHRGQTAFHPVIKELEHAAGFEPTDSDDTRIDKLTCLLEPLSQDVGRDTALFADLLSIPIADRYPPLSVSPQRRKELLLERFISRFADLAARQPVLMILEDAHWIDPTTRELVDIFIERVRGLQILLIITYRPEFVPPWLGQSQVTTLTLTRLSRRDNATMVRQVADGKELPPGLLDQIVTRTDGVPLFIEEMTKTVLESGILREEDNAYMLVQPLPMLAVPPTLQASLVARLDRLATVRAVAQTGAALGREFAYLLLKAVMKISDIELQTLLDKLVASGLVHQRGAVPHAVYTFKHALVQDAAHETLLKSQRVQLHGRIAETLEQEFPEMPERNPEMLAYHCTEAGFWEKAIDYRLRASSMALDRSAGVEAHAQVEMGMSLLPKVTTPSRRQQLEGRLQVALGSTFVMTKGFSSPDVRAALTRARVLLDESTHPIEALRALGGLFQYHLIRSEAPLGLQLCKPLLKRSLEKSAACVAHFFAGTAQLPIGNFKQSQLHLKTSLSLYDEVACRPVAFVAGHHIHSFMFVWLGLATLCTGAVDDARAIISAGVRNARKRAHPFTLVSALLALARFFNHVRNLRGAIDATEKGLRIATDQRSPYHISRANVLRAVNLVESDQPEEAIALMNRALIAQRETGANFQSSFNLSYLALAYARTGNFDRALTTSSEAIEEVERTGERWWAAEAQRLRGEVLLMTSLSNAEQAEQCLLTGLECARQQGARIWELRAALSLARLWRDQGRRVEAYEILARIHSWFPKGVSLSDLKDARALLDELACGAGRETC
jgi:DNA-binding winged helix-turn-helix (wHTH) protein/tetratricopeptide (TPR) repeat protein